MKFHLLGTIFRKQKCSEIHIRTFRIVKIASLYEMLDIFWMLGYSAKMLQLVRDFANIANSAAVLSYQARHLAHQSVEFSSPNCAKTYLPTFVDFFIQILLFAETLLNIDKV
jgi:hypothetical protein